jgi:hypothetical protein
MQHRYAAAHASGNSMDSEKRLITQLSCLKFPSFEAHHGIYRDDEEREYLGVNIIPKPSVVIQKISFGSTVQQETYLAFFPLDSKTEKQLITIEYKLKDEDCLEEYEISRTTT